MKKRYKDEIDKERRNFISTVKKAGISAGLMKASCLVPSMMLSRTVAAQSTPPGRSIVLYIPGGAIDEYWRPRSDFSLPSMSAPLEPVKDECHFLLSMGLSSSGHGVAPIIQAGNYQQDSFDVVMGNTLSKNTSFKYLNLGVMGSGHGYLTRDKKEKLEPLNNPTSAFKLMFGNVSTGSNMPSEPDTSLPSVLDAHREALGALKNKLGSYETARLDEHLSAIESMEKRLNGSVGTCDASGWNAQNFEGDYSISENFTEVAKLQIDLIVLALKCDMTRSFSLALGTHQGEHSFPELNFKGSYHKSMHGGSDPAYPDYQEMRAHLASLSAYLIQRLKTEKDMAGEPLIDNTIVSEITDMGHGDTHGNTNVPLMFAGGGNRIKRGTTTQFSSGKTQLDMLHTAAVALKANEIDGYSQLPNSEVLTGIMA